jgi:hypothetical protein
MKTATTVELRIQSFDAVREFYTSIDSEILFDSPGNYLVVAKERAIPYLVK